MTLRRFALPLVLLVSTALEARAQTYCGPPDPPGKNACSPEVVGDPIHLGWGSAGHELPLVKLDAGAGIELDLKLLYFSSGMETPLTFPVSMYWSHSLDVFLKEGGAYYWAIKTPTLELSAFSSAEDTDGAHDAIDERNHTTLRRVGTGFEWTREDGSVWVFDHEYEDSFHYLSEIRDAQGHPRITIDRSMLDPTIGMIQMPAYSTRVHLDSDAHQRLWRIRIDQGTGSTPSVVAELSYDESDDFLKTVTYADGSTSNLTYQDDLEEQLATVSRTLEGATTTVATFGWDGGRVVTLEDKDHSISMSYDDIDGETTVYDEAHGSGGTRPRATYKWSSYGTEFSRRIDEVVAGSPGLSCVDCARGVGFQTDRRQNRVAQLDTEGVWTTRLYDVDEVVLTRSGVSATMSAEGVLSDSGASFLSAGVQAGDTFRFVQNGVRGCATPKAGRLCDDEFRIAEVTSTTITVAGDAPAAGTYANYWIIRQSVPDPKVAGSSVTVGLRHLIDAGDTDVSSAAAGDTIELFDDGNYVETVTLVAIAPENWLVVATAPVTQWTASVYPTFDVKHGGVPILTDVEAVKVVSANTLFDASKAFRPTLMQGDLVLAPGLASPGTVLEVLSDSLLEVDVPANTYASYEIARMVDAYGNRNGGRILKTIANDLRWNGSACVPDFDPWTEPEGTCAALAHITRYRYGHASYPRWVTAVEQDSVATSVQKHWRIYDFDPTPSVATPSCSNDPNDFDVSPSETQANRIQRVIEFGYTHDASFDVGCTTRITTFTYDSASPYELVELDGPLAGTNDKVTFSYYPSGVSKGRVEKMRRYTGASTYIETNYGVSGCGRSGYDAFGNPLTVQDPNGVVTCLYYDALGRLIETRRSTAPSTTVMKITRQQDGAVAMVVNEAGVAMKYVYGGGEVGAGNAGLLKAIETWSAESSGTLVARQEYDYSEGSSDDNTVKYMREYSRYPTEELACTTNGDCSSDGSVVCSSSECIAKSCSVDADCSTGGPAACREGRCRLLTGLSGSEYDVHRRPRLAKVYRTSSTVGAPDATRQWDRSAGGRLVRVREENRSSNDWNVRYAHDAFGWMSKQYRKLASTEKELVTYGRDRAGNVTTLTYRDETGAAVSTSTYLYDDFGALLVVQSPDAGTVEYRYDATGQLVARLDQFNAVTSYVRDAAGRLTTIDYPTDVDTVFTYDETAAGATLEDCATTSGNITWPGNRYGLGRVTKVVDKLGTKHFNYDLRGAEVSRFDVRTAAGETCARVSSWTYDSVRRLSVQRLPSGRDVRYSYTGDHAGLVNRVEMKFGGSWVDVATHVSHDAAGRLRRVALANGIVNTYDWFLDGSPKARYAKDGGTTLMKRDVTATTAMGFPEDIEGLDAARSESFTYAPDLHALATATVDTYGSTSPYLAENFDYHQTLLGDRSTSDLDIEPDDPAYERHLLTDITYESGSSRIDYRISHEEENGVSSYWVKEGFEYDEAGRVVEMNFFSNYGGSWVGVGGEALTYDEDGRVDSLGDEETSHIYADWRHQVEYLAIDAEEVALELALFHDDGGHLLGEVMCGEPGACVWPRDYQDYVWLGDEILTIVSGTMPARGTVSDDERFYVHTGLLSEPRLATKHDKSIAWRMDIPPFGWSQTYETEPDDGSGGPPSVSIWLGLPGQYRWGGSPTWASNWHRLYRPELGRYLQADPLVTMSAADQSNRATQSQTRAPTGTSNEWKHPSSTYGYALAIPVTYVDRDGLFPWPKFECEDDGGFYYTPQSERHDTTKCQDVYWLQMRKNESCAENTCLCRELTRRFLEARQDCLTPRYLPPDKPSPTEQPLGICRKPPGLIDRSGGR